MIISVFNSESQNPDEWTKWIAKALKRKSNSHKEEMKELAEQVKVIEAKKKKIELSKVCLKFGLLLLTF